MNPSSDSPLAGCWKVTGVRGDRTCPRLPELGHCRHCDVYASAGRQRLDRDIPPGVREEWTELFSHEKDKVVLGSISVIIFRLKDEWFALKTNYFKEATAPAIPHTLPGRTNRVLKGIVNVNGELLLCVSVSDLLDLTPNLPPEDQGKGVLQEDHGTTYARLVVIEREGARFVFPVEEVLGIHRLAPEDLRDAPATLSKAARTFTAGLFTLRGRTVGLLDEEEFFQSLGRSLAA